MPEENKLSNLAIILDLGHRWELLLCQKIHWTAPAVGKEDLKESHIAVHGRSCIKEEGKSCADHLISQWIMWPDEKPKTTSADVLY